MNNQIHLGNQGLLTNTLRFCCYTDHLHSCILDDQEKVLVPNNKQMIILQEGVHMLRIIHNTQHMYGTETC